MFRNAYIKKEEIINSPSRRDGITFEEEMKQRKSIAVLIQKSGIKLRLYPSSKIMNKIQSK
jgi:hypothetical protein